jgi:hypothetical protein
MACSSANMPRSVFAIWFASEDEDEELDGT